MKRKPTYEELEQKIHMLESAQSECMAMLKTLQQRETRYKNLFHNMLHEVHVWELVFDEHKNIKSWKLVDANPVALQSWNKVLPEIIGKTTDEIFPNSNATELFMPVVKKIFEEGLPHMWESYLPDTNQILQMISIPFDEYFISTGLDITDQKQKEEVLRKQNYYLEKAQELGKIGTWELDLINNILVWTDENCRIFGVPEGSVVNYETFISKVHPDDREYVVREWEAGLEGKPYDIEHRLLLDGEVKWVREKADLDFDDNGKVVNAFGFTQDITERKKAEREALFFKTAIDQAPIGVALADENLNIYYCNPEGLAMRGGSNDDLVNISKDAFTNWQVYKLNGEPYETDDLPLVRAIRNIEIIREEFIVRHQGGVDNICDSFACPVFENKKIVGGMVLFLNITERKKFEASLRESEERLHLVMKGSNDAPWDWNLITNNLYYSPQWWAQLGYIPDELPTDAALWQRILHPDDSDRVNSYFQNALENGTSSYEIEFRLLHQKGHYVPILSRGFITRSENGEPTRVSGTNMDLTERKSIENALQHAQKMESIGTLAGGIAHDFNNILSAVLGFTELALDSVDKEIPIKDDLKEVYAAGLRAKDLVKQILTFARQTEEEVKPIQVDYIIKEVLKFLRSSIPTTIEIKQHIDSDSLIMGNATQLHQIMMNLCTNSAHAMEHKGGTLEVVLKETTLDKDSGIGIIKYGNYLEIKVSDTGIGIEPHILKRIFEPYFTTKLPGEGTGMGLALVHGIVDSFSGKIFVESELGKGTVFTIYFPICKSSKTNTIDVSEDLPTGQERILFIDDEVSITKMGSRILGQLGYLVTTMTNSIEALELFQENPTDFDLVISDVTMPGLAGDDLAIKLLQTRPDISVILSTGYNKKLSEQKALKMGVKALTAKPIVKADLAKTIRKVLDE